MTSSKEMPAGNAVKFNAFQLIELKVKSSADEKKHGFSGIIGTAKCVKNKLFPPNIEISVVGNFVRGFSNFWTNYNFLSSCERITTAGAWTSINGYSKKFYAKDAFSLYTTDENFKKIYDEQCKEGIKTDFIDKYNNLNSNELYEYSDIESE
jgi:hypothetical protein